MPAFLQAERPMRVATPLGKDVLLLVGFNGQEGISRPYQFELDVLAENEWDLPFDRLLGQKVTVDLLTNAGKRRFFNGICSRITQGGRDRVFTSYRLEIVPQFALLARRTQSRIFQHLSVPDILKQVLNGLDVNYEIQGTFHPRDYVVQYRESDFAFASRLMEDEGIFYFFTHAVDGHKMVVANTSQSHPDLPEASKLVFEEVVGGERQEDRVFEWRKTQELRSGKVTLFDHCFELPHLHLEADRTIPETVQVGKVPHKQRLGGNDKLELFDFPAGYAGRFDGIGKGGAEQPDELKKIFEDNGRTAGIRIQQEAVRGLVVEGLSTCRQLVSGHKFTLSRHFNADGAYLVTAVEHHAVLTGDFRSGEEGEFSYDNRFTCIPLAQAFRPQRTTAKPCVPGTQTAVVVGPKGQEIFTDKYGRIKVQLHWDRHGKNNADSSCWVRVAQFWAGKRWGASFWPRVGQEVIIDFLEGDPDQPICIGSVYNSDQMPPYLGNGLDPKHPNDNKLCGVKSNSTPGGQGYNEWRFDDTAGKEQVFIHAQNAMDMRVCGSSMESVGGSRHLTVGGEHNGCKMGDQNEMVYGNKHLHVHGNQVGHVEGNQQLYVGPAEGGGNQDVVIEKEQHELIGTDRHVRVKGSSFEKVDNFMHLKVLEGLVEQAKNLDVDILEEHRTHCQKLMLYASNLMSVLGHNSLALKSNGQIRLTAPVIVIDATETLWLQGAGSRIRVDGDGVKLDGPAVEANANPVDSVQKVPAFGDDSADFVLSLPVDPVEAAKAAPTKPTPADSSKSGQKSAPG
jgi:type VI secretion system secreted protein VgrG